MNKKWNKETVKAFAERKSAYSAKTKSAGKSNIVGADGHEHFVPKRDGTIIPSGRLGGKVSVRSVALNVYITVENAWETPAEIKRIVHQGLNELAVELEATLGL